MLSYDLSLGLHSSFFDISLVFFIQNSEPCTGTYQFFRFVFNRTIQNDNFLHNSLITITTYFIVVLGFRISFFKYLMYMYNNIEVRQLFGHYYSDDIVF